MAYFSPLDNVVFDGKLNVSNAPMANEIGIVCQEVYKVLLQKNMKYGNSAAEPVKIFSNTDPLEQIAIRCDDKLKRIQNMGGLAKLTRENPDIDEDTVLDLIGYLLLARAVNLRKLNADKSCGKPVE